MQGAIFVSSIFNSVVIFALHSAVSTGSVKPSRVVEDNSHPSYEIGIVDDIFVHCDGI